MPFGLRDDVGARDGIGVVVGLDDGLLSALLGAFDVGLRVLVGERDGIGVNVGPNDGRVL